MAELVRSTGKEYVKDLENYFHAKAVILNISCMDEIKERVDKLKYRDNLNASQKNLIHSYYEFGLSETDFDIRSVLLFAFPVPARTLAGFTVNGQIKTFPVCLENLDQYRTVTEELKEILAESGYHAVFMPKLPRKILAVSSGLAKYGRNNIAYVEGMGSFVSLLPFYTDIPPGKTELYPLERMESCGKCSLCAGMCPNQAIRTETDIIDSERCLAYFNEEDSKGHPFPEWINPGIHNSVIGCEICQINCPQNKAYRDNEVMAALFDEEETELLLRGAEYEALQGSFKEKVDALHIGYLLRALPRNLQSLFRL